MKCPTQCDLMLALIGDASAAEAAARLWHAPHAGARGAPEPLRRRDRRAPRHAGANRADAGAAALSSMCRGGLAKSAGRRGPANCRRGPMVAVAEAFKLLAGFAGQQLEATLIEFDGYASSGARFARRRLGGGEQARCACEAAVMSASRRDSAPRRRDAPATAPRAGAPSPATRSGCSTSTTRSRRWSRPWIGPGAGASCRPGSPPRASPRRCSRSSRAATWCCTRRCARAFARAATPPAQCCRALESSAASGGGPDSSAASALLDGASAIIERHELAGVGAVAPAPGAIELLRALRAAGGAVAIVTSNSSRTVAAWLRA